MRDWQALVRERLGSLPLEPTRESDIVDELAQHVAQHHADLIAAGVDEAAALARALAPLADREQVIRDIARSDRPRPSAPAPLPPSAHVLVDLARDLRYAVRALRRSPGFAATAIVTLALGIGTNTAMFSMVNAVLLRPLPFADAERLVMIGERGPDGSTGNVGYATFLDWKSRSHTFEDMAVIRSWAAALVQDGEPEQIDGMRVSANFLSLLGARPALGRDFTPGEDNPNDWRVLILSDALWRRRFHADPSIVGRRVMLSDRAFEVVGVMPASFEPLISEHFYKRADMWSLVGYDATLPYACRTCQHLKAIGRVRRGVSQSAARSEVDAVQSRLRIEHPTEYEQSATMALVPLADGLTGAVRPALAALMGAVAFVLLIACANVANLLLARAAHRGRDLALRAALGASRARLVRQLIVESLLLALTGGAIGVAVGALALPLLVRAAPPSAPRLLDARVDGRVLLFSLAVAVGTAFAFGLLPALRVSRVDVRESLQDGGRTAHASTSFARRLLVAADVALAMVLLAGAGLMIKSVGRLLDVDPGFEPDRVLTMDASLVGTAFANNDTVLATVDAMLARLRALPGVEAAAAASQIPLGGNGDRYGFHLQARPAVNPADDPALERYGVTPEYFAVMRIPLRRGRLITAADRPKSDPTVLINERAARTLFPDGDAIGQHVRIGDATVGPWRTIVGIVGDVRHQELSSPPTMQFYVPETQFTDSSLTVVIRTGGDTALVANAARSAIRAAASRVLISNAVPLENLIARSVRPRRFMMALLELFGAAALVLTAIGVYGVIAYSVAERKREIGIRSALGASRGDIVRLVMGGGLSLVVSGLAAGVAIGLGATRYLEGSLFAVSATDPSTFVVVALLLLAVAALAQLVPVVRATQVDPALALRQD